MPATGRAAVGKGQADVGEQCERSLSVSGRGARAGAVLGVGSSAEGVEAFGLVLPA